MAVVGIFLILSGLLLTLANCQSLDSYVPFKTVDNCNEGTNGQTAEYFNAASLSCVQCAENNTVQRKSTDGLSCACRSGYRQTRNFGGAVVTCEACPGSQTVSSDGWECISCPANNNTGAERCNDCQKDTEVTALRQIDGSYVSSTAVPVLSCLTCKQETQPNDQNDQCERCSYTLSIRGQTGTATCTCNSGETKVRGICFPSSEIQDTSSYFQITLENSSPVNSFYLTQNLMADSALCRLYRSITACQSLANMCALVLYEGGNRATQPSPCQLFIQIQGLEFLNLKPPIFVTQSPDNEIINNVIITQWTVDPIMRFPFKIGQFSLEGRFEGYENVSGGLLQLCVAGDSILDAAFVFGTYYSQSCSISALSLWDQVKYPLKFYEIYLEYQDEGEQRIYRIPNKILNLRDERNTKVNLLSMREWHLTRRFFLVDSVGTVRGAGQVAANARYAKNIKLVIQMQADSADGRINVPYFEIEYDDISRQLAESGAKVQVSFSVTYSMSQSNYVRNFQIATGTLSSLGVVYAGYRTYVWSKRAGRITIDFPTLVNFFFFLCSSLANVFFVIVFGIAFYFFIFYKRQNVFYVAHPEGQAYEEWLALFGTAFALKALAVLHMVVMQSSADIFLVDWERPKGQSDQSGDADRQAGKKSGNTVSIWRTYFVANEWNEIQTKRKINKVLQIFAVVFFLVVVGFEDTTTKDPDGSVNKGSDVYRSEQSPVYRMALASLVYLLVAIVQVIFFVFIYERFITDDIREFVDLCSMSNVSMFIMAHGEFGYYIHGRSVHGRSDVNLKEMFEMLDREEKDLVGQRGLVPNTEPQTFIMALPKRLRQKYETLYMPVQLENAIDTTRAGQGRGREKSLEAYGTLNRFLCAFIDHSLRDIDYVVKDKTFLEKVMDTEFLELSDKGIFYNDNGHSFDNVLFYGNELMLIIFDTLLFCIVDLIFMDYVLAGIITYIVTEAICLGRDAAGRKNLVKKTLVDDRFLI